MRVIGFPATMVVVGAPFVPLSKLHWPLVLFCVEVCVILKVLVLGTSADELSTQAPLYTAKPPVPPAIVTVYGNGPTMLWLPLVVTVRTSRAPQPVPLPLPVVGWLKFVICTPTVPPVPLVVCVEANVKLFASSAVTEVSGPVL